MTDFTHQAWREASLQDGQQTDAYKESIAKCNYIILVYKSTDNEVSIHILRRSSAITG
jgi:hypothetical protein